MKEARDEDEVGDVITTLNHRMTEATHPNSSTSAPLHRPPHHTSPPHHSIHFPFIIPFTRVFVYRLFDLSSFLPLSSSLFLSPSLSPPPPLFLFPDVLLQQLWSILGGHCPLPPHRHRRLPRVFAVQQERKEPGGGVSATRTHTLTPASHHHYYHYLHSTH